MGYPVHLEGYPAAIEAYKIGSTHPEALAVPGPGELLEMFAPLLAHESGEVKPTDHGLLGVMRVPTGAHTSVVSVDFCDVTRDTGGGYGRSFDANRDEAHENPLIGYANYEKPPEVQAALEVVLTGLMVRDLIDPVNDIEAIQETLQRLRHNGAYIIGNTSTLPGCEASTARLHATYLDSCFDAFTFPRNHDGTEPITKGSALEIVHASLPETASASITTVGKVDDIPHHLGHTEETARALGLDFVGTSPQTPWNVQSPYHRARTEAEAFLHLEERLRA